jgi:hypothetical protein
MEKYWIRDGKTSERDKHPGSATLHIAFGDGSLSRWVKENRKGREIAVFCTSPWFFHMLPGLSVTDSDPHKSALFWAVLRSRDSRVEDPKLNCLLEPEPKLRTAAQAPAPFYLPPT